MTVLVKNLSAGVKKITINDPKTYNSLSFKTLNNLIKAFKKLDKDNSTKVIILEGVGKGFSAGHNLKEVRNLKKRSKYLKLFNLCSKLMLQIVEGRKPVIAKVHGAAYAAGCQLAASCDLAYSTNDAMFATPGVNIGLFCSTPMVAVSRKVTRKRMMKMLLTGEPIKANYAKEVGLINDHYSKAKLNSEVLKVAKTIASKSNLTIKIGKQAFYKQLEMPLKKAYAYTSKMMTLNMMARDAKEIGLINNHFSSSRLNNEVLKVAKKIASKSNLTIKIGKQAFYKQLEMPLRDAYKYASKMMSLNMMAQDAKEGISAFLEKRKPKWKNK